jgi:hypothetical protein
MQDENALGKRIGGCARIIEPLGRRPQLAIS